jgi:hypothetical protein
VAKEDDFHSGALVLLPCTIVADINTKLPTSDTAGNVIQAQRIFTKRSELHAIPSMSLIPEDRDFMSFVIAFVRLEI